MTSNNVILYRLCNRIEFVLLMVGFALVGLGWASFNVDRSMWVKFSFGFVGPLSVIVVMKSLELN